MSGAELIRWSRTYDRRAGGRIQGWILAIGFGAALAAWVYYRSSVETSASHAWLAGTIAAFGLAFLRVPFLVYWRSDATILAQLPIEGRALFDAAMVRCIGAALTTTIIAAIGAAPLFVFSIDHALRHVAIAGLLGLAAGLFMPAVAVWAASLVDRSILTAVTALGGAPVAEERKAPADGSGAMLGAVPGFAATLVVVTVLLVYPWLVGEPTAKLPPEALIAALGGGSILAFIAARSSVAAKMGTILRDVSALDRQRLATLEIRGPTGIERMIAGMLGEGALPYGKDARLVRRRYPMAFALGAIIFLVLAITGASRPTDPDAWLVVTLVGATAYAIALTGRLRHAPIELARVSATLPIEPATARRAKHAWIIGWWAIFVLAPGLFAVVRQPDLVVGLIALVGATIIAIGSSILRRS